MKLIQFGFYFLAIILLLSCSGDDTLDRRVSSYRPLLMTRQTMEGSFAFLPPRPLKNMGKMVQHGNYVFINEPFKGIHVLDMSNTAQPVPKGFLQIPGNIDVAVVEPNILVADNAVDLLSIDVSNPLAPLLLERKRTVFPEHLPPDVHKVGGIYSDDSRPKGSVIVGWVKK